MKKYITHFILCAILLLAGCFLLFYVWVVISLSGYPLYIRHAFVLLMLTGLLALCLRLLVGKQRRRFLMLGYLAVCAGAAVYVGLGVWRDSIPTMEDRLSLLYQYQPNAPDTKAVRLEEEPTLKLEGNYFLPSMDGATALYPVYAAFAQAVYPEKEYLLDGTYDFTSVACSNTMGAYRRLIDRDVDVIFVAEPSQAQRAAAESAGMELHFTPIGREAFVFFVNSRNPEVGGKNQSIRPFQRIENSGSQSAFQRFMGDIPIMEPEREDVVADMGSIISQVASYRNYKNAIGFSFRYYSTQMVENNQIRLLALNGVPPTKETIRDGSYPISSSFYAVTASPIGQPAPETTNEKLAALLEWILSPQGQWIIEETGYVSLY